MASKTVELDWTAAARALPATPYASRDRLSAVLAEGDDARRLIEVRWLPERDARGRVTVPGFSQALVPATTAAEIGSLLDAIRRAQMDAVYEPPRRVSPIARARKVRSELRMAIDQLARCARIPRAALGPLGAAARTADGLALSLDAYVDLARRYRAGLAALGTFDCALIDEAARLAGQLRELPPRGRHLPERVKAALDLRNRLVRLLEDRIRLVRATARYLFRDHPSLLSKERAGHRRGRGGARNLSRNRVRPAVDTQAWSTRSKAEKAGEDSHDSFHDHQGFTGYQELRPVGHARCGSPQR